ncbi:MAG: hypothetical protein DWI57_14620 [Chloroflexi bacterium]|nr:MAG: hypothetical protein DWI57_14620 [Chloroflexota bacterium]
MNHRFASRISVARWIVLLCLLTAALLLAGCAMEEISPADVQPIEQGETDENEDDYYYTETAEDCWEDEEFDEVDQLCYPVVYCDENGICEEEDYGFLDILFGLVDELAGGVAGGDFEDAAELEENTLITYRVEGNQLVAPELAAVTDDLLDFQADTQAHQKIWVYFARLVPPDQRPYLTKYVVFTDGPEEVLAFVSPDTDDPTKWLLGVDIADTSDPEELTFTLIHEFAHLMTLNSSQVPVDEELALEPDNEELYEEAAAACPVYFPGEGCSEPTSYINAFYERFWADIYEEWSEISWIEDEDEYAAAAEEFYLAREDDFVSDYAATSPEEDIAESFATFVLSPKPTGDTLADEKVAFFYNYPELVKLRAEMNGRLYSRLRRR